MSSLEARGVPTLPPIILASKPILAEERVNVVYPHSPTSIGGKQEDSHSTAPADKQINE